APADDTLSLLDALPFSLPAQAGPSRCPACLAAWPVPVGDAAVAAVDAADAAGGAPAAHPGRCRAQTARACFTTTSPTRCNSSTSPRARAGGGVVAHTAMRTLRVISQS